MRGAPHEEWRVNISPVMPVETGECYGVCKILGGCTDEASCTTLLA